MTCSISSDMGTGELPHSVVWVWESWPHPSGVGRPNRAQIQGLESAHPNIYSICELLEKEGAGPTEARPQDLHDSGQPHYIQEDFW